MDPDTTMQSSAKSNRPLYNLLSIFTVGFLVLIGVASDAIKMTMLTELAGKFGIPGMAIFVCYLALKANSRTLEQHRQDALERQLRHEKEMREILDQYRQDMLEMRRMYESNVRLVEDFSAVSKDLREVVIMNTQAMTEVRSKMADNKFCPALHLPAGQGDIPV